MPQITSFANGEIRWACLGTRSEKKSGGPPLPSLGNPCYKKKELGLFFILEPQEHFWSSPKNHHFG